MGVVILVDPVMRDTLGGADIVMDLLDIGVTVVTCNGMGGPLEGGLPHSTVLLLGRTVTLDDIKEDTEKLLGKLLVRLLELIVEVGGVMVDRMCSGFCPLKLDTTPPELVTLTVCPPEVSIPVPDPPEVSSPVPGPP